MKRIRYPLFMLLAFTAVCGVAWSFTAPHSTTSTPTALKDAVPGNLWINQFTLPTGPGKLNLKMEIRRRSLDRLPKPAIFGGKAVSRDEADQVLSTGLTKIDSQTQVASSFLVVELADFLSDAPQSDTWRVGGQLQVPGLSARLTPEPDFCRGQLKARSWNTPRQSFEGEVCVGWFQSESEDQIFQYYCIVEVTKSKDR